MTDSEKLVILEERMRIAEGKYPGANKDSEETYRTGYWSGWTNVVDYIRNGDGPDNPENES